MTQTIVNHSGKWYLLTEKSDDITMTPLDESRAYNVKKDTSDVRTVKQNASLHKYCLLVSDALNDSGLSMQYIMTLIKKMELTWSMLSVKDIIWRGIQEALLKKKSTTKLTKEEVSYVYKRVDFWLSGTVGIEHIDFPSEESMIFEQKYKDK
jgi:hypothetical protein